MEMLRLKVYCQKSTDVQEIRRISIAQDVEFADVLSKINALFGTSVTTMKYVDDEGDEVLLSSPLEWQECLVVTSHQAALHLHLEAKKISKTSKTITAAKLEEEALAAMANKDFEEALKLFRNAAELKPSARIMYNTACCLALMGQQSQAIQSLKTAISLGYNRWNHMQTDEDLRSLQDCPEFQSLLQQVSRSSAMMTAELVNAAETIGPQIVAAAQKLAPELGSLAQTVMNLFQPRNTGANAAPNPPSTASTPPDMDQVINEALDELNMEFHASAESQTLVAADGDHQPDAPLEDAPIETQAGSPVEPTLVSPCMEPLPGTELAQTIDEPIPDSPEMAALLIKLVELGFGDEQHNRAALKESNGSLSIAVNRLLEGTQ